MSSSSSVTVHILDKEYSIMCPQEERANLVSAARYLDGKMREIRSSGKVIGADRIAVMAALNIAHELIQLQRIRPVTKDETDRRLSQIQERISTALAAEPPVEPPLDASAEKV